MFYTLESRFLFADLEDAVTLGAEGWVTEGSAVLDLGLAAVEAQPLSAITPAVVERYRRAIVCYRDTYGPVPVPHPDLADLRVLTARSLLLVQGD